MKLALVFTAGAVVGAAAVIAVAIIDEIQTGYTG